MIIAYVRRCKEVNPSINAIVEDRFDVAIQEAREIDSFLQTTIDEAKIANEKPLLGLPVTIKESIAVQGESYIFIFPRYECIHTYFGKIKSIHFRIIILCEQNINYDKMLYNRNME